MKNLFALFLTVLFLTACEKQELHHDEQNSLEKEISSRQQSDLITYRLDNIPIIPNTQNVERLLLNPDNRDDEKINLYLHKLSLATRDLIKDSGFNNTIINLARSSETSSANLLDLERVAPRYYNIINANLRAYGLTLRAIANDLTYRPVSPNPDYPETAEIEEYLPSIFVPNLEYLSSNYQPLISPNIEIDGGRDGRYEDNIVTWYFSEDGEIHEIILSEETSLQTRNPLFFLDNAVSTLRIPQQRNARPMNPKSKTTNGTKSGSVLSFSSNEHSIESQSYRYENGGFWNKSEFAINAYRIDPSGDVHWIYDPSGSKVINKIKPNQIGTTRYKWSHHASNWEPWSNPWTPNAYQNNVNMVYWNTYERDWNRSPKGLGTCSANGTTIYLSGKRKYTSEWYAWIPSTTNIHYTRFQWVYDNWAHWNNSWKSKFRLWRVHI